MTVEIAGVPIGPGHPCAFVAELSNNHNGDYDRAVRLLHAAKASGATFAKLQCYSADELVALRGDGPAPAPWGKQGWSMRDLYTHAMTPRAWFAGLFAESHRIGLPLFASVFGAESLALLESLDCPAYKIARLDNGHQQLIDLCTSTGKPIIVSESLAGHVRADITLLCPPGYPQALDAFDQVTAYGGSFDGMSYHGTDWTVGATAALRGASMVEAHFHLAAEPSELESSVSLTEHAFARMTQGAPS